MSSNSSNKGPTSSSRAAKSRQSKPVIIKLPSTKLFRFPHEKPVSKASSTKSPASEQSSTPAVAAYEPSPAAEVKTEGNVEVKAEATPEIASANGPNQPESKRKGLGGPRPGQKRRIGAALIDGQPKPRAKPGPKKRKLDGEEGGRPWTTPNQANGAGHKLGPKANQGAINAGLRALDRTGKPCRKWNKAGFSVKSFTGTMWSLSSWAAPRGKQEVNGDGAENVTPNSTSDNQQPSSNVGSEASHNQLEASIRPDTASSPALIVAPA